MKHPVELHRDLLNTHAQQSVRAAAADKQATDTVVAELQTLSHKECMEVVNVVARGQLYDIIAA